MLLASCGTDIKFHTWPSGDYYGSYKIPNVGLYLPNISWCKKGEFLITTVPTLGSPLVIAVNGGSIQTYQVVDLTRIQAVSFSRTIQENVALGTETGAVAIYDLNRQSIKHQLVSCSYGIKYLEYSANDTILAAACKNGQIVLYNSKNKVCSTFCVPNANNLTAMSCHSKLVDLLAAASMDGIVVVWDTGTGNTKLLNKSHRASVTGLSFSCNYTLASVGLDKRLIGYDIRSKECIFCSESEEKLSAVDFMPYSDIIAVGSVDGKLFCYDNRQITYPVHTIVAHHPKAIGKIAFQSSASFEECEICDIQANGSSKSNVTTIVVPIKAQERAPNLSRAYSREDSAVNSITEETDSDWEIHAGQLSAYLENLQNNTNIDNKGSCVSPSRSEQRPPTAYHQLPKRSSSTADINNLNKNLGNSNILKKFSIPPCTVNVAPYNRTCTDQVKIGYETERSNEISSWLKRMSLDPSDNVEMSRVVTNQNESILQLRKELEDAMKGTVEQLTEMIDREFINVRMEMSRGFAQIEQKMNKRWKEFNAALVAPTECDLTAEDVKNDSTLDLLCQEGLDSSSSSHEIHNLKDV